MQDYRSLDKFGPLGPNKGLVSDALETFVHLLAGLGPTSDLN